MRIYRDKIENVYVDKKNIHYVYFVNEIYFECIRDHSKLYNDHLEALDNNEELSQEHENEYYCCSECNQECSDECYDNAPKTKGEGYLFFSSRKLTEKEIFSYFGYNNNDYDIRGEITDITCSDDMYNCPCCEEPTGGVLISAQLDDEWDNYIGAWSGGDYECLNCNASIVINAENSEIKLVSRNYGLDDENKIFCHHFANDYQHYEVDSYADRTSLKLVSSKGNELSKIDIASGYADFSVIDKCLGLMSEHGLDYDRARQYMLFM